jgi:predicted small lipoprotein YifL
MKKYFLILLALLTVLTLVACGADTPATQPNTPEGGETVTPPETPEDEGPALTVASNMTIYMKKPVKLDYTVKGDKAPTFTSTNANIVSISEDGMLSGLTPGTAAVSVTLDGVTKGCVVKVETYEPVAPGKTEEALGVLPLGSYTITLNDGANTPVSYNVDPSTIKDNKNAPDSIKLAVGEDFTRFTIVYQTIGDDPYYIVWVEDQYLYNLSPSSPYSISNGREILMYNKKSSSGGKVYYDDMANGYKWHIRQNADGSYSFYSHLNDAMCLSYKDGKFVAETAATATGITSFNLNLEKRGTKLFNQYISSEGAITLRLPTKAKSRSGLTDERAQKWANDLNIAYEAFVELTSYRVYDNIVVKAYEPCTHIGYVYTNCQYNVISIGTDFAVNDLAKMVKRDKEAAGDWNFCAMHEMGHLFDSQVGWYFETEMMTDFKLAYCLTKGGTVAPSEFDASDYFSFENIMECYDKLGGGPMDKSKKYGAYQAAYVFLRIQKQIGWEPFKQTYAWFIETGTKPSAKYDKFFVFLDKLTEFSGKDVRKLFSANEWKTFCENYGYTET